jgi:glucose-6-phosphate isomerase
MDMPPDVKKLLQSLKDESFCSQLETVFGRTYEESVSLGAKKLADVGFEPKGLERINRMGWTLAGLRWILADPQAIDSVLSLGETIAKKSRYVIFAGMGGSGLSVQTVKTAYGSGGFPIFSLRTTDPAVLSDILGEISALEAGSMKRALERTTVVAVSKSGTTLETLAHREYFESLFKAYGIDAAEHMLLLTDPGSSWGNEASRRSLKMVHIQPNGGTDIGGRFSSPTTLVFLLPMALIAPTEVMDILEKAKSMNECQDLFKDQFIILGAYLTHLAKDKGKDKVTLFLPEPFRDISMWAEQLFEESLGKNGRGLSIFYDEDIQGKSIREKSENDRVFVRVNLAEKKTKSLLWELLVKRGYPTFDIEVADRNSIGGLMLGLQRTVATIAYLWGICFVDQPAVEGYKKVAHEMMSSLQVGARVTVPLEWEQDCASFRGIKLYYGSIFSTGSFNREDLDHETLALGSSASDAAATYAAIIRILNGKRKGFEAAELTTYARMSPRIRNILEAARSDIFTNGLKIPCKLGEGPDKNHSYQQNIEDGRNMYFSTNLLPLVSEQPIQLGFDDNLIRAQAIGTVKSMVRNGRKTVLITLESRLRDSESDLEEFFRQVRHHMAQQANIQKA